jgi:hypothetical protein
VICRRSEFKMRERLRSEDDSRARDLLASNMQAAGAVMHLELPLHSQDIAVLRSASSVLSGDRRCSHLDPRVGPFARPIARPRGRPPVFVQSNEFSRSIQPLKMSPCLVASGSSWRERAERAGRAQKARGRACVSLAVGRRQGSLGVGRGAGAVICGHTQCEEMNVVVRAYSSEGIRGPQDVVRDRVSLIHSCEASLSDEHGHDGRFVQDSHRQFLSAELHRRVFARDATQLASLLCRQDHPASGSKAGVHSARISPPGPGLVVTPLGPPCEARHA